MRLLHECRTCGAVRADHERTCRYCGNSLVVYNDIVQPAVTSDELMKASMMSTPFIPNLELMFCEFIPMYTIEYKGHKVVRPGEKHVYMSLR